MKTILISLLGFFLVVQCNSSPTQFINNIVEEKFIKNIAESTKNGTTKDQSADRDIPENKKDLNTILNNHNVTTDTSRSTNATNINIMENKEVIIIDLEKVNKMSPPEYIGRQIRSLLAYLLFGGKDEKESSFIGRCMGIAKKVRQLIPIVMIGGGIMITKLAFLVLFSLKTIGLLGLLLLLNVGTAAAKLGALLASKKSDHSAQTLNFHVKPSHSDDHIYSSSHLKGPPYGWDDKSDINIEEHELYNLYEKLKLENDLRKYFSPFRGG